MQTGRTKSFDFSNKEDRKDILDLCYGEIFDKTITDRVLSLRIFGKTTPQIKFLKGNWGIAWPNNKIRKIYKISSDKYKVVLNINWFNTETNISKRIGKAHLYLKKDPNSYYGYIVRSMKLKKIANI